MSAPTVTITLKPQASLSAVEREALVEGLHMLYVQAEKGEVRHQWVVFPPPCAGLDVKVEGAAGMMLVLERVQQHTGNRSKWFHRRFPVGQTTARLSDELAKLAGDGFKVGGVVAVPLEEDDYKEAWSGDTPHKAMRAVDRALRPYKITVKGTD